MSQKQTYDNYFKQKLSQKELQKDAVNHSHACEFKRNLSDCETDFTIQSFRKIVNQPFYIETN